MNRIDAIHPSQPRRDLPPFRSGDTVRVHVSITEGDKQRIQVFEGVVIRRRGGGASATFTVRKISYGVGVERIFLTEAPSVDEGRDQGARPRAARAPLLPARPARQEGAPALEAARPLVAARSRREGAGTAAEADAAERSVSRAEQHAAEGEAAPEKAPEARA